MGDQANDIFLSFLLSEEDQKNLMQFWKNSKVTVWNGGMSFMSEWNLTRGYNRNANLLKTLLLICIYALSKMCNYGELTNEMIRDRIVVGIRDNSMAEHLQIDAELLQSSTKLSASHNKVKC